MSEEEIPLSQRDQLAMAVAEGKSIALWARQNGVATRTAQRWAAEPDVRRQVEDSRRRILDRALGYMAGRSMWAVRGITKLEKPPSPSPFNSGRGGPFCTTRLPSPSFRISSTAWPSWRKKSVFAMETRLTRVKAGLGPRVLDLNDRSPWDWYAEGYSCASAPGPGECRTHPRARTSQRPPAGDWRVWAYVAGRGAGKTRAGAGWIQHRVETGIMTLGCLIAPTMADIRDVMVEGPSGLLAVAPRGAGLGSNRQNAASPGPTAPRRLPERRRARARPRAECRHDLGRRAGLLAACRIDLGHGDAGAAGRHQSPGPDHDNAAPRRRAQAHPCRGDHRPDDRYHVCQRGPSAARIHRSDRRVI